MVIVLTMLGCIDHGVSGRRGDAKVHGDEHIEGDESVRYKCCGFDVSLWPEFSSYQGEVEAIEGRMIGVCGSLGRRDDPVAPFSMCPPTQHLIMRPSGEGLYELAIVGSLGGIPLGCHPPSMDCEVLNCVPQELNAGQWCVCGLALHAASDPGTGVLDIRASAVCDGATTE